MPGRIPLWGFAFLVLAATVSGLAGSSFGGHPLGTEDAVTQGRGNAQAEFNVEHSPTGGGARESSLGNVYTLGLTRRIDFAVSFTYLFVDPGGGQESIRGMGDTEVTVKTSFRDGSGWIPAAGVKAGAALPTGDEEKGLGAGQTNGLLTVIADWKAGPVVIHANAGATIASRPIGSRHRDDSLSASLAAEWEVRDRYFLVGEYLWEKNIGASGSPSSELLVGAFAALSRNLTIDVGIRWAMTDASPDVSYLAGITLAFTGGE